MSGRGTENLVFSLAGRIDASQVRRVWEQMRLFLREARGGVAIDVSNVSKIDGAAVQLLLALRRALADRGIEMQWHGAAPALVEAARILGMVEELGLGYGESNHGATPA
jgi:ABC-type transporter Mla MlaB component